MKIKNWILILFCMTWLIPQSILQNIFCPPLLRYSEGLELQCYFGPQTVDCSRATNYGTLAVYNCQKNFASSTGNNNPYRMICQQTGQWSEQNFFQNYRCNRGNENGNVCGKVQRKVVPLLVRGDVTSPEFWPWHATLFQDYIYSCGGTLISPNVVLTAAHCVVDQNSKALPPQVITVVLGASSSKFEETGRNAQKFIVKKIVIYPEYNSDRFQKFDIALLFLNGNAVKNYFVSPVCLPTSDNVLNNIGLFGEVVGYGVADLRKIDEASSKLRHAELPLVSPETCFAGGDDRPDVSKFCAGSESATAKAACYGDSGGGFFIKDDGAGSQRYVIHGIVSTTPASKPCQSYARFTKVVFFLPWIQAEVNRGDLPAATVSATLHNPPIQIKPTNNYVVITSPQAVALNLHNNYRGFHGAAPLKLNQALNAEAQTWADSSINTGNSLSPKQGTGHGQNLFEFTIIGGTKSPEEVMKMAVENWYSTKRFYNPKNPTSTTSSYGFTQLVWRDTTDLGVAYSTRGGRTVVVAFYSPAGNVVLIGGDRNKYFRENVQV